MKPAALRLTLAAALFAAWIGWLVYLVYSMKSSVPPGAARPVVLSRPQFLVSSLDVGADVPEIDADPVEVTVREVFWPKTSRDLAGKKIKVNHLRECREDWLGPGEYILPLERLAEDGYQVVPLPRSPGFPSGRPRIYPSTPQTRAQLNEIRKASTFQFSQQGQAKAEDQRDQGQ
jgi:hypothetical protein